MNDSQQAQVVPAETVQASEAQAQEAPPAANEAVPNDSNTNPLRIGTVLDHIQDPFDEERFKHAVARHFEALARIYNVEQYDVLYLLDRADELDTWHQNRIYAAISRDPPKPIMLIIDSLGGRIEPGYLISKTCKRLAKDRFIVAVPRQAKSAATLLALGADEIHMGLMSELGPIDPQFGGFPALGIRNALEILSDLACRYPGASSMLGDFLKDKLDMRFLGFYERINESARQYAERLLDGKVFPGSSTARSLADHFVNHYKDHGFVIDADESERLLGNGIIKQGTREYEFANAVFEMFDLIQLMLKYRLKKGVDLVGKAGEIRTFPIKSKGE